jgi:hypothetical protein
MGLRFFCGYARLTPQMSTKIRMNYLCQPIAGLLFITVNFFQDGSSYVFYILRNTTGPGFTANRFDYTKELTIFRFNGIAGCRLFIKGKGFLYIHHLLNNDLPGLSYLLIRARDIIKINA